MYLGPFYLDTKEIFLILAALLIGLATFFGWSIYWFDKRVLLTIIILMLVTKGLLPAIHNEAFFILAIVTIFLTLYLPVFQVILFYFLSFVLFRFLKVIQQEVTITPKFVIGSCHRYFLFTFLDYFCQSFTLLYTLRMLVVKSISTFLIAFFNFVIGTR